MWALGLLLISLAAISLRSSRPKLQPVHLGMMGFWGIAWSGVILFWWSENASGGGWIGPEIIAIIALYDWAAGLGVIALIGFTAYAIVAGPKARSVILLALPLLVGASLYSESTEQWEGTDTGLSPGQLPEGWVWHGATGDPDNTYDAYIYVEQTDPDRPPNEENQLVIAVRREPRDYPPGRTITRDDRLFRVFDLPGETLVVEHLGNVRIEVSSNKLPEETLLEVAERVDYDPEFDAGAK